MTASTTVGGWRAQQLHHALVASFGLSSKHYGLSQLRYDLRKLRAHALLERDGSRYTYRLTDKGVKVALLFVLFHQRTEQEAVEFVEAKRRARALRRAQPYLESRS